MNASTDFDDVLRVLADLALHDPDLADNRVVERIARLKEVTLAVPTSEQPWAAEWMSAEHLKGSVLYTAAKINWNRDRDGNATISDRAMRGTIIRRFNEWVRTFASRVRTFRDSAQTGDVVAGWRRELAAFHDDPINNP